MSISRVRGRHLQRLRRLVRMEQPLCVHCERKGITRAWEELDHIIPLEHGGTNTRDNLQGLCRHHHLAKTARDRGYKDQSCGVDGVPLNPDHHWNG